MLAGDSGTFLDNTVFLEASDASGLTMDQNSGKRSVSSQSAPTQDPSLNDIMTVLIGVQGQVKLMNEKLAKLDTLELKVVSFEAEIKKIWCFIDNKHKEADERLSKVYDRVEQLEFSHGVAVDQLTQMRNTKACVDDTLLYVQSQSMRNNLLFTNIPEPVHENPEASEVTLRQFMINKLKLAQSYIDSIQFERVHRIRVHTSHPRSSGRPDSIVAKFCFFKDREIVRRSRSALKGTDFFISEQFPKEINDRRKALLPALRKAKSDGKTAWLSYDRLFVDGRPVSVDPDVASTSRH